MSAQRKTGWQAALAAAALALTGGAGVYAGERYDEARAAQITWLRPDGASPAERAGLSVGDKILEVNGAPVADRAALLETLDGLGDRAVLRVLFAKTGEVRDVRVAPDPHLGIHFKIVIVAK